MCYRTALLFCDSAHDLHGLDLEPSVINGGLAWYPLDNANGVVSSALQSRVFA